MDRACCRALADLFYELMLFVILVVFLLVSAAIRNENCCKFNSLCYYAIVGQGHHSMPTIAGYPRDSCHDVRPVLFEPGHSLRAIDDTLECFPGRILQGF